MSANALATMFEESMDDILAFEGDSSSSQAVNRAAQHKETSAIFFILRI